MKRKILFILLILSIVILTGCKDISDSYKPGSFGKTTEEKQVVDAITAKYGDLTQDGEPRFLEATMTSEIVNAIPVNKVSAFSKDEPKLAAWFVYDNFHKDVLNIEWTYQDEDYVIHTFKSETGDDLGRGTFILEQPDDGWPLGNYQVTISGAGVTESLTFKIIDGPTVSTPFNIEGVTISETEKDASDSTESANAPGWYLTGVTDFDEEADDSDSVYTYSLKYDRPSITASTIGSDGQTLIVKTTWEEPPKYMAAEQEIVLTLEKKAITMDMGNLGLKDYSGISFDVADIKPGGATASQIEFEDDELGDSIVVGFRNEEDKVATMKAKAPKSTYGGGKMSLTVDVYTGFLNNGARYEYEWRD